MLGTEAAANCRICTVRRVHSGSDETLLHDAST